MTLGFCLLVGAAADVGGWSTAFTMIPRDRTGPSQVDPDTFYVEPDPSPSTKSGDADWARA